MVGVPEVEVGRVMVATIALPAKSMSTVSLKLCCLCVALCASSFFVIVLGALKM